jgi:hypothetical protein
MRRMVQDAPLHLPPFVSIAHTSPPARVVQRWAMSTTAHVSRVASAAQSRVLLTAAGHGLHVCHLLAQIVPGCERPLGEVDVVPLDQGADGCRWGHRILPPQVWLADLLMHGVDDDHRHHYAATT